MGCDKMNEAANMIKHEIKQLSKKEDQAKQVTSDLSLPILKSIEEKISKLVSNLSPSPEAQPSVRPKEQSKEEHPAKESKDTKAKEGSGDSNTGSIIEMRRGLLFASSIGLGCNLRDLQDQLDSEIIAVPTYHIEKVEAKDPDLNLKQNLKLELEKNQNIDFIIIAIGSNDISNLSIEEKGIGDLTTDACNQSKHIVHLANEASEKYNIEVFVVEKKTKRGWS